MYLAWPHHDELRIISRNDSCPKLSAHLVYVIMMNYYIADDSFGQNQQT